MGRPKDEYYWNKVDRTKDGKLKCKSCKHKFTGGVSRIKDDKGVEQKDKKKGRRGVKLCTRRGDSEGHDNNDVAGSSNPQQGVVNPMNSLQVARGAHEMIDPIPTIAGSSNHPNYTQSNTLCEGGLHVEDIKELVDNLVREENEVKGQLQWLKSHGKRCKKHVDDLLDKALDLKKRALEVVELSGQSTDAVWDELGRHIASKPLVLWNELVGDEFEKNFGDVLKLLRDDEVFVIGIHGMGGVGKTCLVTHVKDHIEYQITRNATYDFQHVFWVTVSQNFSIFKLQNDIAKIIGITLDEDDEVIRAEILSSALEKNEKWVLILDDVWNYIDLYKVGISPRLNGNKLILTSRLKHVCLQMDCSLNNIILMKPLSAQEGWELFLLKLGCHGTSAKLPPEVEEVARSVAKECDGLPLGVSVMARTMKGVEDISRWRHALNKLQNSAVEEMGAEVLKVLKFSYDHLIDKNMQNCFLNCALYAKIDHKCREEFIMMFVDKGLINGMGSLEEVFDEGLVILDKLKSHSLLLEDEDGSLWLHCLVRDMTCHMMRHKYMVKCNKRLTKLPQISEWTADLDVVSLAENMIEDIPAHTSPKCPELSTLIFSHNLFSCIPYWFFRHMNTLTVLDLSENNNLTRLPNSMSDLRSLISLVLRGCKSLQYIPPLGQLQKLLRLDISDTSIKQVPRGFEMLINLKWLNLSGNDKLMLEPRSILLNLSNIQYLDLRCHLGSANVVVKVEDVQGMRMLHCFACSFHDGKNLNDYVRKILESGNGPQTYHLHLGIVPQSASDTLNGYYYRPNILDDRVVSFGDCEDFVHLLPRDLTKLRIEENKQWNRTKCLCDALSFNVPSSLRHIHIKGCSKLESLFCLSGTCSLCTRLQCLDSLLLDNLANIGVILKQNDEGIMQLFPLGGLFSHLKHLQIKNCHKIEKLLTAESLPQLPNLEQIFVAHCNSMKEIFTGRNSKDDDSTITLDKLTKLTLICLPQLKVVYRGILASKSRPKVDYHLCPNLGGTLLKEDELNHPSWMETRLLSDIEVSRIHDLMS